MSFPGAFRRKLPGGKALRIKRKKELATKRHKNTKSLVNFVPFCGWLRVIFLVSRPPLLTRRGMRPTDISSIHSHVLTPWATLGYQQIHLTSELEWS